MAVVETIQYHVITLYALPVPTYKYILYTASPFAGYLQTNTIQSEFTPQLGASGGKGEDNFILQLPDFTFLQIKICVMDHVPKTGGF